MPLSHSELAEFLSQQDPYASLPQATRADLAARMIQRELPAGARVYTFGDRLDGLFIVVSGGIEVRDAHGEQVSLLGPRNSFGERGLARDGLAATTADTTEPTHLLVLPPDAWHALLAAEPAVRRFFDRARPRRTEGADLATSRVAEIMAPAPHVVPPDTPAQEAARRMRAAGISSLCVTEGDRLAGIVTLRDLSGKVLAEGLPGDTPIRTVMTPHPITLEPAALGSDVLHTMMEHGIGHVPICDGARLVGMVTQTDLTRYRASTAADLVGEVAHAPDAEAMARITARIPLLLRQLVGAGTRHEVTTRLVTDVADAATRRLISLAEAELGSPPVPYLWLACGSQGRQEQTGVSDQDNCLVIDDAATEDDMRWFAALAQRVCDGLDRCGYVYCPGDMMASNPRWRQRQSKWRSDFMGWIATPSPEARMLASVMFDLRPIGGDRTLFESLQAETLEAASRNSIFVSHMIANSLTHTPPLGLVRGLALIRSGEHKNTLDLKHSGVVPVTDLARVYALRGRIEPVNTRARLTAARATGTVSDRGGRDLIDAYDVIAEARLAHQVRRIRHGEAPDNYLAPAELSDFDRAHLRDAFVVVKGMQSAVGHGRGMLG